MGKILTAYFSASGVTKKTAEKLAEAAGADLFEIVPAEPYTKKDLNWLNPKSRSSVEMNDRTARPAVQTKIVNLSQYSHVFVGFPIWWYREPSIIDTFLESYDWSGIALIPFCTSGGSDLGEAPENMADLAPGAVMKEGRRLSPRISEKELRAWVNEVLA